MIWLDKTAVHCYSVLKKKLGLSDDFAGKILTCFRARSERIREHGVNLTATGPCGIGLESLPMGSGDEKKKAVTVVVL